MGVPYESNTKRYREDPLKSNHSPHQVGWLLLFSIGPVELMSLVSGFIVIYSWIM